MTCVHLVLADQLTFMLDDPFVEIVEKFDTGVNVMVTGGRNQGRVGVVSGRERHPGGFDVSRWPASKRRTLLGAG